MTTATEDTRICPACQEPRALNQFRKRRDGVTRRDRCRRCTKLNTRRERWQSRQAGPHA